MWLKNFHIHVQEDGTLISWTTNKGRSVLRAVVLDSNLMSWAASKGGMGRTSITMQQEMWLKNFHIHVQEDGTLISWTTNKGRSVLRAVVLDSNLMSWAASKGGMGRKSITMQQEMWLKISWTTNKGSMGRAQVLDVAQPEMWKKRFHATQAMHFQECRPSVS